MNYLLTAIDPFFFARRSAWPFGLLRIGWAAVTLAFLLTQWNDVAAYYSDNGFLPRALMHQVTRTAWKLTLLDLQGDAWFAIALFVSLLITLTCSLLGILPRLSTILSAVLLASFHERNTMTLGGGDTVLRTLGFILMIAPGIEALSLARLQQQITSWRTSRALLPPVTMPAWPYRLLLWQMIVLYGMSLWWKLLGTQWWNGTAVATALHHPLYLQWSFRVTNILLPFTPIITWATLAWEALWLLLLLPAPLTRRLPLKRIILAGGVLFHGSIAVLMNVGSFSFAVLAGYLGLLDDTDRAFVTRMADRRLPHPISVLYDGSCRLCRRSAFILALLDPFHHLRLVDFRDRGARIHVAPHLSLAELDLAMHIVFPDHSTRTGFDAFRAIAWHLPLLWPAVPFLSLPGIAHLGRSLYARIARSRQKCAHDRC